MPALDSRIVPHGDAYRQNHAALTELVDQLRTPRSAHRPSWPVVRLR